MHKLVSYLLDNQDVSLETLIEQSGDDVTAKEAANVIQFCFIKLSEAIQNREFQPASNSTIVLNKLLDFLLESKAAFTDPVHIATIFHTLGKITYATQENAALVKNQRNLLKKLLNAFAENEDLNDQAIATLFNGLGRLKHNDALPDNADWQSIKFYSMLLALINNLDKPNTQAVAMFMFGLAKLQITNWSEDNKALLDTILKKSIITFLTLEETQQDNKLKPKAQEISNFLYAIAKLSKQNALTPSVWQNEKYQEKIHEIIQLMFKKNPSSLTISHTFYAIGILAKTQCLISHPALSYSMRSLIKYEIYRKESIDYRTRIIIFVALGRLADCNLIDINYWQQERELFNGLLKGIFFEKPQDISDFLLGIGRLAEKNIITKEFWQPYQGKTMRLIEKFKALDSDIQHKSAFYLGLQKLYQHGFIQGEASNYAADQNNRSLSNSPLTRQFESTFEEDELDALEDATSASTVKARPSGK